MVTVVSEVSMRTVVTVSTVWTEVVVFSMLALGALRRTTIAVLAIDLSIVFITNRLSLLVTAMRMTSSVVEMMAVDVAVRVRVTTMIRVSSFVFVTIGLTILSTALTDRDLLTVGWSDIGRELRFNSTSRCNNSSKGGELEHFQNFIFNEESGRFKTLFPTVFRMHLDTNGN